MQAFLGVEFKKYTIFKKKNSEIHINTLSNWHELIKMHNTAEQKPLNYKGT